MTTTTGTTTTRPSELSRRLSLARPTLAKLLAFHARSASGFAEATVRRERSR